MLNMSLKLAFVNIYTILVSSMYVYADEVPLYCPPAIAIHCDKSECTVAPPYSSVWKFFKKNYDGKALAFYGAVNTGLYYLRDTYCVYGSNENSFVILKAIPPNLMEDPYITNSRNERGSCKANNRLACPMLYH